MKKIRKLKTILNEYDLEVIKDIYINSECYNEIEFYKMVLEQFGSDELIDEIIQKNICPECYEQELEIQVIYEDDFGRVCIAQCNSCGNTIDID